MYYTRNYSPSKSSNFYLTQLPKLREVNSTVILRGNDVVSLYDVIKGSVVSYFTYSGSFTTPNCEETVTWFVNRMPVRIRSEDLANFRMLKNSGGNRIMKNYRPIQLQNNRKISIFSNLR
jgi:carbonic anhydrase